MKEPEPPAGAMTWVIRIILALAALAAPILVYKGFTDPESPDPAGQQRLREAAPSNATPAVPRP